MNWSLGLGIFWLTSPYGDTLTTRFLSTTLRRRGRRDWLESPWCAAGYNTSIKIDQGMCHFSGMKEGTGHSPKALIPWVVATLDDFFSLHQIILEFLLDFLLDGRRWSQEERIGTLLTLEDWIGISYSNNVPKFPSTQQYSPRSISQTILVTYFFSSEDKGMSLFNWR